MKTFFGGKRMIENRKISTLTFLGVIVSLAMSFVDTIWSLYIDSFVHSAFLVGLVSSLTTAIYFVSYFFVIPLVERKEKIKLYTFSLLIFALTYFLFSIFSSFALLILLCFVLSFFGSLMITSFGILVKDFSKNRNLAKNEGILYSLRNVAWVVGPLIAGFLLSSYGFKLVFFISALIFALGFLVVRSSRLRNKDIKKKVDKNLIRNFFDFFKNKNRVFAYLLSGGVSVWWSLIYVFIPVYIVERGLADLVVGYFLFAVALPLVFTEFYFSKLASKKGFRKLFKRGYLIVVFASLICFFVSNIYLMLLVLVLGSFGMGMLESTTEAYFFDILNEKQHLRFYGPFNTADSSLSLIARLSASAILFLFPFKYVFLLFGLFMLFYFILSFFIKERIESRMK